MEFKMGDEVYFIYKDHKNKPDGVDYQLVAKSGILGERLHTGEYEIGFLSDMDNPVVIVRNENNIFKSKSKCEKAITKLYQEKIYHFLKEAIDIFDRNLR